MGEGNRKTGRLLKAQPTCTYCGGVNASTSRDHCPPTCVFDDRWRPEGMEFGACDACHQGTREMDAVMGFLARIRSSEDAPNRAEELQHYIGAVVRRYPHLLAHFTVHEQPVLYNGSLGHITEIGPDSALHGVMEAFAARMGLAVYRLHHGDPAPPHARIIVRWSTNYDLDGDDEMNAFLQCMGLPRTLMQGKKNVVDQFRYWSATAADEPGLLACFAAFRDSFGVTAFVDTREDEPLFEAAFSPGFLQGYHV